MNLERFANFQAIEPGAEIVSMINYKDMFIVATRQNIWVVKDGKIELMEFEMQRVADAAR